VSTRTYGIGLSVLALVVSFAAVFGIGSKFAVRDDRSASSTAPSSTAPPTGTPTASGSPTGATGSPTGTAAETGATTADGPAGQPGTIRIQPGQLSRLGQDRVELVPDVTVWRADSRLGGARICVQLPKPWQIEGWEHEPSDDNGRTDDNAYCRQLDGDPSEPVEIRVVKR
jgi:hypothetical protein